MTPGRQRPAVGAAHAGAKEHAPHLADDGLAGCVPATQARGILLSWKRPLARLRAAIGRGLDPVLGFSVRRSLAVLGGCVGGQVSRHLLADGVSIAVGASSGRRRRAANIAAAAFVAERLAC